MHSHERSQTWNMQERSVISDKYPGTVVRAKVPHLSDIGWMLLSDHSEEPLACRIYLMYIFLNMGNFLGKCDAS